MAAREPDRIHPRMAQGGIRRRTVAVLKQIGRCVRQGHLVAVEGLPGLPADFTAAPQIGARFAFFAGAKNRCFLPESQQRSWQFVDALRPGFHSLHVLPEYSYPDMFMGKNAATDVFPLMIRELDK